MVNIAPEDMSGDVPQWPFMMRVVKRIAQAEGWTAARRVVAVP
jgi:hypothetical protein